MAQDEPVQAAGGRADHLLGLRGVVGTPGALGRSGGRAGRLGVGTSPWSMPDVVVLLRGGP